MSDHENEPKLLFSLNLASGSGNTTEDIIDESSHIKTYIEKLMRMSILILLVIENYKCITDSTDATTGADLVKFTRRREVGSR